MEFAQFAFTGNLLKAGDDNSRWKPRYFQIRLNHGNQSKLQYFENDRDALRGKSPKGELLVSDIQSICVFSNMTTNNDPNVQACAALTSEHVQEGVTKLLIFGGDRFWRLAELTTQSHVIGDLIRALDRLVIIPRLSIRMVGWMRSQGSLSWNRRYALLLSNGELLLFLDASLDHLRRRIDLAKAQEIRPKQPLASHGSVSEKRVLRLLESTPFQTNEQMWSADTSDLLGIRLTHPNIPERSGYIMCVERSSSNEEASVVYARFRKWIVQLQLSCAESRLSSFQSSSSTSSATTSATTSTTTTINAVNKPIEEEKEDFQLERQLTQLVGSIVSSDVAKPLVWDYLCRFGSLPALLRSQLWFVLSNGSHLKRITTSTTTYANLVIKEEVCLPDDLARVVSALNKYDGEHTTTINPTLVKMLLQHGGEEVCFWTCVGFADNMSVASGFSLHTESHVIVDLLALKHPPVMAHLSSYDLIKPLVRFLVKFLPNVITPQVWDGAFVMGDSREAITFVTVFLLSRRHKELLECFGEDELTKVVFDALIEEQHEILQIPWKNIDLTLSRMVRKAQWAHITSVMRDHSLLLNMWNLVAKEVKTLVVQTVVHCNRLDEGDAQEGEEDPWVRIHQFSVLLNSQSSKVITLADMSERALEHEMLRSVGGGANSPKGSSSLPSSSNHDATSVVPMVEVLNVQLTSFAFACLSLAWKSWIEANGLAFNATFSHFVPKGSRMTNTVVVALNEQDEQHQQQHQQQQTGTTSIKSLANGIRRRLFTSVQNEQQEIATAALAAVEEEQDSKTPPTTPFLDVIPPLGLLNKYRGGILGLIEVAGTQLDASLARDLKRNDIVLMRLLDVFDVTLRVASTASMLQRWLCRRSLDFESLTTNDFPVEIKHLFVSTRFSFDRDRQRLLEESLAELHMRCK